MIRRAVITLAGDDDKDEPKSQVSYLGKTADVEMINPYGLHSNPSADKEVSVTMWTIAGEEAYRVGMGYTPRLRPKNLPVGEVVLYHPLTQSRIQFKNNGDIEIDATGDNGSAILTIKKDLNITVSGDATITVAGATTLNTTGKIDIISGGDVNITGSTINLN